MSKYARMRIGLEVSDASDYSRAATHGVEITATPDEKRVAEGIDVATAGQTYYLAHLTACTDFLLYNADTTANGGNGNYLTVTWQSEGNGAVPNIARVAAGKSLLISDLRVVAGAVVDVTLQANSAVVPVEISYLGT